MKDHNPIGLVAPPLHRSPHPAAGMTAHVHFGDGAYARVVDPYAEITLGWALRYSDPQPYRLVAASVIDSFTYLLSEDITTTEAIARLRILRRARADLLEQARKRKEPR